MLAARDLRVGFRASLFARPLDLAFAPSALTMIFGANGIGKTTLLQTLAGLLAPVSGEVRHGERAVADLPPRERARRLAYVHSLDADVATPGLRVRDVVGLGRSARTPWWSWRDSAADAAAIDAALRRCALEALAERPYAAISSGERQRAWLAAALATEAEVLLLDEPTSRLDLRYAREMLGLLRDAARAGATVIAAMHDVAAAGAFADRAVVLDATGALAEGAPIEALTTATLSRAYGTALLAEYREGALWVRHG